MAFASTISSTPLMPRRSTCAYRYFPGRNSAAPKVPLIHVGLDHDGLLPSFVTVTDGKSHDVTVGRTLKLPKDSIVVMDRAYTDYTWFNALNDKGIFFVIRQKRNAT